VTWKSQPTAGAEGRPRICSIADALEILGDRWSLLVVRECSYGVHRFTDIQRNTGAATDILTSRLKRLEAVGMLYGLATLLTLVRSAEAFSPVQRRLPR
jgi:DNA-binding HxlR family transcriptional regulator